MNLFEKNKYAGDDRKEHGFRINYGISLKFNDVGGSSNTFLFIEMVLVNLSNQMNNEYYT